MWHYFFLLSFEKREIQLLLESSSRYFFHLHSPRESMNNIDFATFWGNMYISIGQFSSVTQSCPPLCDPMDCITPGLLVCHQLPVYSNSGPLSQWCHPTNSSSFIPFSSHLQSFPASGSFQMSQLFASGGQSTGVSASASVLPMNTQDWSPLGWTGWTPCYSLELCIQMSISFLFSFVFCFSFHSYF